MTTLEKLAIIPIGQILLANIYAAVSNDHVNINLIKKLIQTCIKEIDNSPGSYDKPEEIYDLIISQIRKNFSQYKFKRLQIPKGKKFTNFAVVLDLNKFVYTAETKIMNDAKLRDLGITRETIDNDSEIAQLVADFFSNGKYLIDNATLGKAYGIFWGTATEEVKKFSTNADRIRNILGLIDYKENRHLFLITCSSSLIYLINDTSVSVAAPTFFEAQDNKRFKELSDVPCEDNWGRTADLEKVNHIKKTMVDGAPEIILSKIKIDNNFKCSYIGSTNSPPLVTMNNLLNYLLKGNPGKKLQMN